MAKLLKGGKDLAIIEVEPINAEKGFELEQCYSLMGCDMVQVVNLMDGRILICDEEALLKSDTRMNETATALATVAYSMWYPIYGTCILCKDEEFK